MGTPLFGRYVTFAPTDFRCLTMGFTIHRHWSSYYLLSWAMMNFLYYAIAMTKPEDILRLKNDTKKLAVEHPKVLLLWILGTGKGPKDPQNHLPWTELDDHIPLLVSPGPRSLPMVDPVVHNPPPYLVVDQQLFVVISFCLARWTGGYVAEAGWSNPGLATITNHIWPDLTITNHEYGSIARNHYYSTDIFKYPIYYHSRSQ